ncbi:hypothetical protein C8F01DRAFT_1032778 [Mycena amicta]|nr:hypothetical protein C8F01DRAFT_1032778 [Mycena amicta]
MPSPPPNDITLDRASLLALVLESFNIGLFTILFAATVHTILLKETHKRNNLLLPTLCIIWVLSLAHWIIDIVRAFQGFLDTPAGALAYYADVADPLETAKTAVYVTVTQTGDFFMIYRCFIVWNRKWRVVLLPMLMWGGTAVTGYGVTYLLGKAAGNGIFFAQLQPWITSFFSMSLSINLICTALIAFKILITRMALQKDHPGNSRVYSALIIFLESAAFYSTSLLILLIVYVLNSNAQYVMLDVTTSLIGVTFSLIILRLAVNEPAISTTGTTGVIFRSPRRMATFTVDDTEFSGANSHPLTAVSVSRLVETTSDSADLKHPAFAMNMGASYAGKVDESKM